MKNTIKQLILLSLIILVTSSHGLAFADVADNSDNSLILVGIGIGITTAGSIGTFILNATFLNAEQPNYRLGLSGVLFGVSNMALVAIFDQHDNEHLSNKSWIAAGTISSLSIAFGAWSMHAARSDNTANSNAKWKLEPIAFRAEVSTAYGFLFSMSF